MKGQVAKMDQELATYHSINTSLNLEVMLVELKPCLTKQIGELKSKLTAAEHNGGALRDQSMMLRTLVARFRADLQLAARDLQNPRALVAAISALHAKYCAEDAAEAALALDEEIQREHNRQREFLERSIASLRHKVPRFTL